MKTLYIAGCLLLSVSIAAEFVAKARYSEAVVATARTVTITPAERAFSREKANELTKAGDGISMAGLFTAIVGIGLWTTAWRRGNRQTLLFPITLTAAYFALWLLLV